jgi:hypothetical protein
MERLWGLFSTGTEKDDFTSFSGLALIRNGEKGARFGLIFLPWNNCRFHGLFHTLPSGEDTVFS